MDYSIKITKVINGYVLSPSDDLIPEFRELVIEDKGEGLKDEQLAFQKLCYTLKDLFGVNNDKHANDGNGQYLTISVSGEEE